MMNTNNKLLDESVSPTARIVPYYEKHGTVHVPLGDKQRMVLPREAVETATFEHCPYFQLSPGLVFIRSIRLPVYRVNAGVFELYSIHLDARLEYAA